MDVLKIGEAAAAVRTTVMAAAFAWGSNARKMDGEAAAAAGAALVARIDRLAAQGTLAVA